MPAGGAATRPEAARGDPSSTALPPYRLTALPLTAHLTFNHTAQIIHPRPHAALRGSREVHGAHQMTRGIGGPPSIQFAGASQQKRQQRRQFLNEMLLFGRVPQREKLLSIRWVSPIL